MSTPFFTAAGARLSAAAPDGSSEGGSAWHHTTANPPRLC